MLEKFSLTRKFPFLIKMFKSVFPKILDFTDFPEYRALLRLLINERNLKLKYIDNSYNMDEWNLKIIDLLSISSISNVKLRRIGSHNDGGYFVPDLYWNSCDWITIGLGSNVDFENELVLNECRVTSFDHTIKVRPSNLHADVKYNALGWGNKISSNEQILISLESMLKIAEYREDSLGNWCLKFDIEGNEWDCIEQLIDLSNKPSVIVCEVHNMIWNEKIADDKSIIRSLSDLLSLYKICFSHGNNYSEYFSTPEYGIYNIIEITLVRNDLVKSLNFCNDDLSLSIPKNYNNITQMPIGRTRRQGIN